MTDHVKELAVAIWRVDEIVESLSPADLTDLSIAPCLQHLQMVTEGLAERAALMETTHVC